MDTNFETYFIDECAIVAFKYNSLLIEMIQIKSDTSAEYLRLKPQESFGRFVKNVLDLQKVDRTISKHH